MLELLIERQHPLIRHHPLLSILKVANVEDNIPNIESSAQPTFAFFSSLVVNPCSLIILVVIFHTAASYLQLLLLASSTVTLALFRQQPSRRPTKPGYDDQTEPVVQKNENNNDSHNSHQSSRYHNSSATIIPHHQKATSYEAAGQLKSYFSPYVFLVSPYSRQSNSASLPTQASRRNPSATRETRQPATNVAPPVTIQLRRTEKRNGSSTPSWPLTKCTTIRRTMSTSYHNPIRENQLS